MRSVLRLLGTRNGIALVLCVLVLAVVGAFRGISGSRQPDAVAPVIATSVAPSVDPSEGDDGEVEAIAGTAAPSLSAGAADPGQVATRFTTAWLKHSGVTPEAWLAGLRPHATPLLLDKLKGVDPARVPADSITGEVRVNARDAELVEASVPVDSGTVRLRLIVAKGQWRVDGVDWERPT